MIVYCIDLYRYNTKWCLVVYTFPNYSAFHIPFWVGSSADGLMDEEAGEWIDHIDPDIHGFIWKVPPNLPLDLASWFSPSRSTMFSLPSHGPLRQDLCYGVGGMVAPYIAILVHRHSWDVLATVDLVMAFWVVRRRACIGCWDMLGPGGIPSGKLWHNYGKSPFFMGKSTRNGNFQ